MPRNKTTIEYSELSALEQGFADCRAAIRDIHSSPTIARRIWSTDHA